ncbi:UNVERIFIED_CONTAM: hypothetical protein RMT77_008597 [Armadillidium vulgare]
MSRSSRVRKKSSKFADFESPDDVEMVFKKKKSVVQKSPQAQKIISQKVDDFDSGDSYSDDSDSDLDMKEDFVGFNEDWGENVHSGDTAADEFEKEGNLQVDEGSSKDDPNFNQSNSLYLTEKKKSSAKEQKNMSKKKTERKDKGKARFTAYMLYARDMRKKIVEENPQMDYSAVNKTLGEMWAHVPYTQKQNWKRKAKKLEVKDDKLKPSGNTMISTGKREKKTHSNANKTSQGHKGKGQTTHGNKGGNKGQNKTPPVSQTSTITSQKSTYQTPKAKVITHTVPEASPPTSFKVTGTSPIDVAAHLNLLGESLNNIGQKLKEHEGQIAVSGSLSVLLDSMLCVLGPLICLSNQLEETKGAIPEHTLTNILDNIAYIMPGIV